KTLIVGASRDGTTARAAGAAYVYRSDPDNRWGTGTLIPPPSNDRPSGFGSTVLLNTDGTLFIVGAPAEYVPVTSADGATSAREGAAHLFRESSPDSNAPRQQPVRGN